MGLEFWIGTLFGGILVGFIFWLFDPKWLRKKVGIEPKDPYFTQISKLDNLHKDPLVGKLVPEPSEMRWAMEEQFIPFQQEGYEFLLTEDGRRCAMLQHDYRGTRNLFLMKKMNNG